MRIPSVALACALALLVLPVFAAGADKVVRFYNWSDYLPEELLEAFTLETGIKVEYATYDGNEKLYDDMKSGEGYDLVVPSAYFVSRMAKEGMLQPLDRTRLPNLVNLDPRVLNKPYDPGNRYSVPYLWGSTGLAFNADKVDPARLTGWSDLWRPEFAGKILLHDDPREVFHMALRVLGYPGNSTDPRQIEAAYQKLQKLAPAVKVFDSESPKTRYLSGEVTAGMIYNGEADAARKALSKIRYVYPREGAIFWVDNLAIPANAKNPENAHKLVNFLLRPAVARRISEETGYATPNIKALLALDPKVQADRTIYPSDEEVQKGEFQADVGEAANALYDRYWEKLKAGR